MAARQSSSAQQRQLSLTEELEKLEQSITLTLQEIDHNFSRAHRIVTSSILPIVEQYAGHSRDVWEGSKFWKQFFESSANVSLSGYEEQAFQPSTLDDTTSEDPSNVTTHTTLETSSYDTPSAQHISTDSIQDIDLSNITISPSKSSTPRPLAKSKQAADQPSFAEYSSPYEALRAEYNQTAVDNTALSEAPVTPGPSTTFQPSQIAMSPQSSPFLPPQPTQTRPGLAQTKTDPLLHHVLDKTYRIQATPMTSRRQNKPSGSTPGTSRKLFKSADLSSSPAMAPPELHEELFSPQKRPQRTPGVSVLTPARGTSNLPLLSKKSNILKTPQQAINQNAAWDFDSDSDTDLQIHNSPPKTMQFHVPQSRLVQTPAREASKRIVEDILQTAGLGHGDLDDDLSKELDDDYIDLTGADLDFEDAGRGKGLADDTSPSVVRRAVGLEDETF